MDHKDISRILFTPQQIADKVIELGRKISFDYADKRLAVVGVLRGGVVFCADLIRHIQLPLELSFIETSSYKNGTTSQGTVDIVASSSFTPEGFDVLIVEDIIDTGNTLNAVCQRFLEQGARSVKTCCMLDKPSRRKLPLFADYVGFTIPDKFVVGYGLDYANRYRNLPYIGILSRRVYEN